jgi:hypothetical protein
VKENKMEDQRCCGGGNCIINDEGECWCGQRWDGTKMCFPILETEKKEDDDV